MNPNIPEEQMCEECGHLHVFWLSCYSASKLRYEKETGLDFWTGERLDETRN